jgi:S-formylglutathione hydrolase FrmB
LETPSAVAFTIYVNLLYALPHDYKDNKAYSYVAETVPSKNDSSPGVTKTWFVAALVAFGEYNPN